ncbi:hypothetical protein GOBAR_AA12163 [Gossypium barbadense]|uniref:Uncharacterized protein n=1 Tax=Gossypium barbadense TaxID=3634 RepID=A0A2P5XYR7_GOSBA|nr:hypothetical protein GOBAR_AA12163 [Gossypium barbadense]
MSSSRGKKAVVLASKKRKGASSSAGPTAKIRHPLLQFPRAPRRTFPDTLGPTFNCGLVRQFSVPEFGTALGLYKEEFKEDNDLDALTRHIHFSPSKCWHTLAYGAASYNPSCSKASVLPPSLKYLQAILAHTITRRHVIDLAYFIALVIQHQTERHRKGVISIGPYVTRRRDTSGSPTPRPKNHP